MELSVFRPSQVIDMARDYTLLADGRKIATIKRGQTQTVSIPQTTQYIQAKIDWCSSRKVAVESLSSRQLIVRNTFASNLLNALLLPLYYVTFGRNNYLTIDVVDQPTSESTKARQIKVPQAH